MYDGSTHNAASFSNKVTDLYPNNRTVRESDSRGALCLATRSETTSHRNLSIGSHEICRFWLRHRRISCSPVRVPGTLASPSLPVSRH